MLLFLRFEPVNQSKSAAASLQSLFSVHTGQTLQQEAETPDVQDEQQPR